LAQKPKSPHSDNVIAPNGSFLFHSTPWLSLARQRQSGRLFQKPVAVPFSALFIPLPSLCQLPQMGDAPDFLNFPADQMGDVREIMN